MPIETVRDNQWWCGACGGGPALRRVDSRSVVHVAEFAGVGWGLGWLGTGWVGRVGWQHPAFLAEQSTHRRRLCVFTPR
jgi:hypothetical protein